MNTTLIEKQLKKLFENSNPNWIKVSFILSKLDFSFINIEQRESIFDPSSLIRLYLFRLIKGFNYYEKVIDYLNSIERIILFGSVAKSESDNESDIDIFIEIKERNKKLEQNIIEVAGKFYGSREAALFKTKGIENAFDIKIGILKDWKDLYRSIASTGIILYGPYEAKELPSEVKHYAIIYWESIGKNRGSFLNKLYGFNVKNKYYVDLLEKLDAKKIGKSCILVPVQYKEDILKLCKEHNAKVRILEVFS